MVNLAGYSLAFGILDHFGGENQEDFLQLLEQCAFGNVGPEDDLATEVAILAC